MIAFLDRHYDIYAFGAMMLIALTMAWSAPAQAAAPQGAAGQPAAPTQDVAVSDNCVEEASIGDIKFYFCEGDFGPDFMTNSYGWMWPVD